MPTESEELTVDELAARVGMTVRNVRAYASRGLMAPPRLEGRTGYYSTTHLQRLQLIRQLLDRGYTLAAIEKALKSTPDSASGPTLDLISMLDLPPDGDDTEIMSRADLAALAGVGLDSTLIEGLAALNLVAWIEGSDTHVRLLEPTIVRTGAAAVAIGVEPETVIKLFGPIDDHLHDVANLLVSSIAGEIVDPFINEGMPEQRWPEILSKIEKLLPIASQIVLAVFRRQLQEAIDNVVDYEIQGMGRQQEVSGSENRA